MNQLRTAHKALKHEFAKGYELFEAATKDVEAVQRERLLTIIRQNTGSEFGRKHLFSTIENTQDFQRQVPISEYSDYEPAIRRLCAGEHNILTTDPIHLLEPTSGSVTKKLIPYNNGLRQDFQRAISPWLYDTYTHMPELDGLTAYWSLSPSTSADPEGVLTVGFDEDTSYLTDGQRAAISKTLSVPSVVNRIEDPETFWYVTSRFLLADEKLGFISVWSPTYLLLLLSKIRRHQKQLIQDIEQGTLSAHLPPEIHKLLPIITPDTLRADELRAANNLFSSAWPNLKLVSCWADGPSKRHIPQLKELLPGVTIQPKGLLATEGVISIPLFAAKSCALAIASHFFEFQRLSDGKIMLAHEVRTGEQYQPIITTSGGLYRYRLHDVVLVTGRYNEAPTLAFIGKSSLISDICGEKVSALQVQDILESVELTDSEFAMLAPEENRYVLFIESTQKDHALLEISSSVEQQLMGNYHYRHARRLGQLRHLRCFRIDSKGMETFVERMAQNSRLGDVKPTPLSSKSGWAKFFKGEYIDG